MGLRQRHRQQEAPSPVPARDSQSAGKETNAVMADRTDFASDFSKSWPMGVLVAVLVGIAYVETMAPSIVGGDNSEMVVAACQMSVAHPPGYPLLTLLGSTFAWLFPVGEFAYRVNVLNMGMGVLSAVTVFASARHVSRSEIGGVVAAVSFALHPLTWTYHGHYEVFALNNLLCGLIVFLAVLFESSTRPSPGIALLGALLSGLAISNQHTSVLLAAPVALRVLWRLQRHGRLTAKLLLGLTWNALVGLTPYAFLPLSSARNPQGGWGNQSTLKGFLVHFLREEYGTFQLYSGNDRVQTGGTFFIGLYLYFSDFMRSNFYIFGLLGFFGCSMAIRVPAGWRTPPDQGAPGTPAVAASSGTQLQPAPGTNNKKAAYSAKDKKDKGVQSPSAYNTKATQALSSANKEDGNDGEGRGKGSRGPLTQDRAGIVRSWRLLLALLAIYNAVFQFLANIPLDNALSLSVQQRFWMQSNLIASVFVGLGTSTLFEAIFNRQPVSEDAAAIAALLAARTGKPPPLPTDPSVLAAQQREKRRVWQRAAALALAALLSLLCRARNMEAVNQSNNRYFYRYGRDHLTHLPQGSLLLLTGDMHYYPVGYSQWCEGYRPDVRLLELSMASYDWFAPRYARHLPGVTIPGTHYVRAKSRTELGPYNSKDIYDANIGRMPIYVLDWMEGDTSAQSYYDLIPYGFLQRVLPKEQSAALDLATWANESLAICASLMVPDPSKYDASTWENTLRNDLLNAYMIWSRFALSQVHLIDDKSEVGAELKRRLLRHAQRFLEDITASRWVDHPALVHMLLGYVYEFRYKSTLEAADKQRMAVQFRRFLAKTDKNDMSRPVVSALMAQYHLPSNG